MTSMLAALLTAAAAAPLGVRADVLSAPASIDGDGGASLAAFEEQRAALDGSWEERASPATGGAWKAEQTTSGGGGRTERFEQPYGQYGPYRVYRPRHDARQGFLFSIGIGGGSLRVSGAAPDGGIGHTGAVDFGLRMGYGFSDRFQLFGDITADVGTFGGGEDVTNWVLSLRGQTVLIGDRQGNGLNVNAGFGIGGTSITYPTQGFRNDSPAGFALVAGLSYDARVARQFALSPELYVTWHAVPNGPGFDSDNATTVGLRLNFLWYAP